MLPESRPHRERHRRVPAQHERKELLRFVTCGWVDDGKSTLIGRLLTTRRRSTRTSSRPSQEATPTAARRRRARPLAAHRRPQAEREQGITIDVAYRYFSTARRKFIIADTPGHVQYTRNMATGASTGDVADHPDRRAARRGRADAPPRYIASLLGIPHLVVAVNKMDLVAYAEEAFDRIQRGLRGVRGASSGSRRALHPDLGAERRQRRACRARRCRGTGARPAGLPRDGARVVGSEPDRLPLPRADT